MTTRNRVGYKVFTVGTVKAVMDSHGIKLSNATLMMDASPNMERSILHTIQQKSQVVLVLNKS